MTSLAELESKLNAARERHQAALQEESRARSAATDALNALNEAQKTFDAKVAELRKSAHVSSDWGRSRQRGEGVA